MELKDILAISGKPGLYQYISQGRNGIIVESLNDKKRMNAHTSMKISSLEDIAIFTDEGEVSLAEILLNIKDKESGNEALSHKAGANELKDYFLEILPNYDQERVYVSDIKKVISWYNMLHKYQLLDIVKIQEEDEENNENADSESEKPEQKAE
jgi:hypothetical protein